MHFSIPDTQEFKDENSSSYVSYNVHVNGVLHCTVRYRQLHNLHEQLKKEFGAGCLPNFPPKKLLSLTVAQIEERRALLERYVQLVSQESKIVNSSTFKCFLISAQQETQQQESVEVSLDVFLMNGHKITVKILSTDQSDEVLEAVATEIGLPDEFVYYFGLFLVRKEDDGGNSIVRKLQDFEAPYISLKTGFGKLRIVLRKSFWDPSYDDDLLDDRIAMNLLYVQAVSDVERGWVLVSKETQKQLAALQAKGSKKEYLQLVRTLKYYGFLQFKSCTSDYPSPNSRVIVRAGNRELNFLIHFGENQAKEGIFKVTRMRCWRITTSTTDKNEDSNKSTQEPRLELAFEYLISKDKLQWITMTSEQAILMSMCLQGMVEELLMKKRGNRMRRPCDRMKRSSSQSYMKRDGSSNYSLNKSPSNNGFVENEEVTGSQKGKDNVKKLSEKFSSVTVKSSLRSPTSPKSIVENDAFDGIGDDDL